MGLVFLGTKTSYSRDGVCQKAKTILATAAMAQQDSELGNSSKFTKGYDVVCLTHLKFLFCFVV